jgi:hypothetical protein
MKYLRAFVIASSFLVFLPHFIAVAGLDETKINYTYKQYTFIAPLYYGVMNMISLYLALQFNLSNRQRYLLIGTISPLIVVLSAYLFKTYQYDNIEWISYGIRLFIKHFLIWNLVIYHLNNQV